jgi:hypothetical protein
MLSQLVAHGPGYEEEATVDEEEAVRIVSGEPPGSITPLKRKWTKLDGNDGIKRFQ